MDGRGAYGITNTNSLGVELCQDVTTGRNVWEWDFHPTTRAQAILMFAKLMKEYNVPLSRVVRHWDASRKSCPGNWMANDWAKWKLWKKDLETYVTTGKLVDSQRGIVYDTDGSTVTTPTQKTTAQPTTKTTEKPVVNVTKPKKSILEIAKEVINGIWGVGTARKKKLEEAGYSYTEVQGTVNDIVTSKSTKNTTTSNNVTQNKNEMIGEYEFLYTVNVRNNPDLSQKSLSGLYYLPGEIVVIESNVVAHGFVWGVYKSYNGKTRYVALKEVNGKDYVKKH